MSDLDKIVYSYYSDHFSELPNDKQFHFASRLHLWHREPAASKWLASLREFYTCGDSPDEALKQTIDEAAVLPSLGSTNAAKLREPYIQKYPLLRPCVSAMFRTLFMKTIYGLDASQSLYQFFSSEEIELLAATLQQDSEAISILSTHAVNFLYLYFGVIKDDLEHLNIESIWEVGQSHYDLTDPIHIQLLIYLYTHCIIGETQFYFRAISSARKQIYKKMIVSLESLIDSKYKMINLDNKFEFLVCCQIMGYDSHLKNRIYQEAANSISEKGNWLIDKHNDNPQTNNITLDKSEHRNVLFIMSNHNFKPLSVRKV